MEDARLVTLVGPGGVGKTALAAEIMNEIEPDYDQVIGVELAEARDRSDVARLVAGAVLADGTAQFDRVVGALSSLTTAIVIDNCEQLIDDVAEVVIGLLDSGADLRVVATSRRPLGIDEEIIWPVRPLSVPAKPVTTGWSGDGHDDNHRSNRTGDSVGELTAIPAVQLFLERVRQAVPTFELTEANRIMVAGICAATEGLPLTLELAAAVVRSRPLDEILAALTADPSRLMIERRDRAGHQRSIGASVDWSRQFLDPADVELLDRLSVFVGGFSAEAARHVDPVGSGDGLARLVDHSLIDFDPDVDRYRMLEVVRLDAEGRLNVDQREGLRRRHLAFCQSVAEQIEATMVEPDPDHRFPRFELELGNLALAARLALGADDLDGFRRLVGPVALWWVHYLAPASIEVWERVFAGTTVPLPWRANIASSLGFHLSHRGDYERSIEYARSAAGLHAEAGDHLSQALDEVAIGNAHLALDRRDAARAAYLRASEVAERSGHPYAILTVLVCQIRLDPDGHETPARLTRAHSLANVGFGAIEAAVVVEAGLLRLREGDLDEARRLCDQALAMAEDRHYAEVLAAALNARSEVASAEGERETAERLLRRALGVGRRFAHQGVIDRAEAGLSALHETSSSDSGHPATVAGPGRAHPEQVLSDRELSVARLLRGDLTQREIADELYIAPSTVKTHIKSIYRKLEVAKRSSAVTRAAELGLFD